MKTVSFHDLKCGRSASRPVVAADGLELSSGLNLIVAPNGAGKSTFFQTVGGVLAPLSGQVHLDGKVQLDSSRVQLVSEYLTFPKFLTPLEWVSAFGPPPSDLSHWAKELRLEKLLSSYLGRMSQGERRKVTWLAAHAGNRPLLLLDEPLDGLDLYAIEGARRMLKHWSQEGRIILVVAHQVAEVLDLSRQVLLIRDGKLQPWNAFYKEAPASLSFLEFRSRVAEFYGVPTA
jgi:ABC-type multidrug transport system ATPase subunit